MRPTNDDSVDDDAREARRRAALDARLSDRFIALDDAGYFLIAIDRDRSQICAAHYANTIGEDGLARDPVTGEVIPCDGSYSAKPTATYEGSSAKEISVALFESDGGRGKCSMMSHANYLGREFQRAEECLRTGEKYVQD